MISPSIIFRGNVYTRNNWKYLPTFTLSYFFLHFSELSMLKNKQQTFNVRSISETEKRYSQVWLKMISDNYVSIVVIYYPFNDHGIYVSNIQNSMLSFHNKNIVLVYDGLQENIANNYVRNFGNLQRLSYCCIYLSYSQHQCEIHPSHFDKYFIK